MWIIAAGLAGTPIYNTDEVTIDVGRQKIGEMRSTLLAHLKRKKFTVRWRNPDGSLSAVLPAKKGGPAFRELDRPVLLALVLGIGEPGTTREEFDLVFRDREGELRPVTLWIEGKRSLIVSQGEAIPSLPAGPSMDQLTARYGWSGATAVEASWEPKVRGALDLAYGLLSPEERAAVSDVALLRRGGDERPIRVPHSKGSVNTAIYAAVGKTAHIEIYDEAVAQTGRFVGPVSDPHHPTVMILLHELGHALADTPVRHLSRDHETLRLENNAMVSRYNERLDAVNTKIAAYNRGGDEGLLRKIDALQRELVDRSEAIERTQVKLAGMKRRLLTPDAAAGSIATAFLEATGCEPTTYATSSADEAFAEAFALYKLDPDALERIEPAAIAWFEGGHHLR